jgi:diguanylate cyclase (GGDEF)-like protein/PAS domain S-box-containing protein
MDAAMSPATASQSRKSWLRYQARRNRVLLTATAVTAVVILLRLTGLLQGLELAAIDQGFRWRPLPAINDRIVIVGMDEPDLISQDWPLSDEKLANLIQQIKAGNPRVIGLDIYRNLPKKPGRQQLQAVFQSTPNLIGIQLLAPPHKPTSAVPAPSALAAAQVGFNNFIADSDQRVRRNLLYWQDGDQSSESFALKIALKYLEAEKVEPKAAPGYRPSALQLGKAILPKLQKYDSVYVRADLSSYQILADYQRPTPHYQRVTVTDVLNNQIPPTVWRDRIVLIGSVAGSLKDYVATPHSNLSQDSPELTPGVELHANFVAQLINAALSGQGVFRWWPEWLEWLLIWLSAYWGTFVSWRLRSSNRSIVVLSATTLGLIGCSYLSFLHYWIVPIVPPLMALLIAGAVVIIYIARAKEELKRSKEFLHRIINSIPDPVFVKDRSRRWIVLNQAYVDFIGQPIDNLLGKSAEQVFPPPLAHLISDLDNQVFQQQRTIEVEEEFTDPQGKHFYLATKRSLHKDGGGNLFLIGVIRDITARKALEEELKRNQDRLSQDNTQLSYLANHDALTGLPNRKLFQERVKQTIEHSLAHKKQFALLFLDLDGFKQVNDNLGHGVGDLLLQAVAKRLTACLRGSDTVARLGGDEFVVIVPHIPGVAVAKRVAKKILATLAEEFTIEGHIIHVTTSIGISMYPGDSDEMGSLMQKADSAMYEAKQRGKNQFVITKTPRRIEAESSIRG